MTDFHTLCSELHDALEKRCETLEENRLLDRSAAALRAALAQPKPVAPTDEELDELYFDFEAGHVESWRHFVRAVLARWGQP
jgi:hypothetical protein